MLIVGRVLNRLNALKVNFLELQQQQNLQSDYRAPPVKTWPLSAATPRQKAEDLPVCLSTENQAGEVFFPNLTNADQQSIALEWLTRVCGRNN